MGERIIEKLIGFVFGVIFCACFILMISTDPGYVLLGTVLFDVFLGLMAVAGFVIFLVERRREDV